MANKKLSLAKLGKNDEFYTQLADIENELKYYRHHFKDKVVFCNCDDPYESNFFKYFVLNFNYLGIKKLICTCYDGSPIAGEELSLFDFVEGEEISKDKIAYKVIINEVKIKDGLTLDDIKEIINSSPNLITRLNGNGDFRSPECIELLKESDIVVTNPPFSLFREYVLQLFEYEKSFLILGNMNAITYKEIFPLIKDNKLWTGFGFNMSMIYKTTYQNILESNRKYVKSKGYNPDDNYVKVPSVCWFTNLDIKKRNAELFLYKKYKGNESEYPKYDNYDAINVDKVTDIPCDYYGVMGVPITFLDKYNPDQFVILGATQRGCHDEVPDTKKYDDYIEVKQNGKPTGSKGSKTNENANLGRNDGKKNYFINKEGHIVQSCYQRLFIQRRGKI